MEQHKHIHNVIQPIVYKDTKLRHITNQTVPIKHVVHKAVDLVPPRQMDPMTVDDFEAQLGKGLDGPTAAVTADALLPDTGPTRSEEGPPAEAVSQLNKGF